MCTVLKAAFFALFGLFTSPSILSRIIAHGSLPALTNPGVPVHTRSISFHTVATSQIFRSITL